MNGILANTKYYLLAILNWSILMLFLVSVAIFITLNLTSIMVSVSQQTITHVMQQQIIADYWRLMHFLQLPWIDSLHFNFVPLSSTGKQHFNDVRNLILFNEAVLVVTGVISLRFLRHKKKKQQLWQLLLPSRTILTAVPVFCGLLAINFNSAFIKFHQLMFRNQDWVFNPNTDPIINILNETFFIQSFLLFVILLETELLIIYWLSVHQSTISE